MQRRQRKVQAELPAVRPAGGGEPSAAQAVTAPLSVIAGYRVLRKLGAGSRSTVYLGRADPGGATVAIKVFRPDADGASIEREISALSSVPTGRLAGLVDLATLPDGRVALVLERLAGGSLSAVLRARGVVEPGESVTILAPVVVALSALHDAGFAHTTLSHASVIFDATGRPVLTGLGGLRDLPPFGDGGRARLDLVRDDYARLTVLMRRVFAHLAGDTPLARRAEVVAAWFEMATATLPFQPVLTELERRLFDWAPPSPVGPVPPDAELASPRVPARIEGREAAGVLPHRPSEPADRSANGRAPDPARRPVGRRGTARPPGNVRTAIRRALGALGRSPLEPIRRRLGRRLRRGPVLVAGCLAGAATILALTLIPARPAPTTDVGAPAGAPPSVSAGPQAADQVADRAAIAGDDPVLAVPPLLRARAACLAVASVVCLDAVDQGGSAAIAMDGYSVRMAQQGGPEPVANAYPSYAASLVERTGNSALVALAPPGTEPESRPASLLVVKGEAGWRLREIFDD